MDAQTKNTPPLIIKQSVTSLAVKLIFLQLLFDGIYLLIHFFFILVNLPPSIKLVALSLDSVFLILVIFLQIYFTIAVVLKRRYYYCQLKPGELMFINGIVSRKEKIYPLQNIESLSLNQDILGKLLNYGTIRLYNPLLRQNIYIAEIHNPDKYIKIIEAAMGELEGKRSNKILFTAAKT